MPLHDHLCFASCCDVASCLTQAMMLQRSQAAPSPQQLAIRTRAPAQPERELSPSQPAERPADLPDLMQFADSPLAAPSQVQLHALPSLVLAEVLRRISSLGCVLVGLSAQDHVMMMMMMISLDLAQLAFCPQSPEMSPVPVKGAADPSLAPCAGSLRPWR